MPAKSQRYLSEFACWMAYHGHDTQFARIIECATVRAFSDAIVGLGLTNYDALNNKVGVAMKATIDLIPEHIRDIIKSHGEDKEAKYE